MTDYHASEPMTFVTPLPLCSFKVGVPITAVRERNPSTERGMAKPSCGAGNASSPTHLRDSARLTHANLKRVVRWSMLLVAASSGPCPGQDAANQPSVGKPTSGAGLGVPNWSVLKPPRRGGHRQHGTQPTSASSRAQLQYRPRPRETRRTPERPGLCAWSKTSVRTSSRSALSWPHRLAGSRRERREPSQDPMTS